MEGESNLIFYSVNGRIAGLDHKWVQDVLPVMVAMFCRMELELFLRRPRPWSAHKVSSGGSGGIKHTGDRRRKKGNNNNNNNNIKTSPMMAQYLNTTKIFTK